MTGSKGGYVTVDSDEREDDVEDEEEQKRIIDPNRKNCRPLYMFLSVVIPLVLLNILLSGLWWRCYHISEENCVRPKLSYSPAKHIISYDKKRLMRDIEHNDFTGEPRLEFDAAWRHLLEPMTIKITAAELSHLPDSSIAFRDGTGFIAELAAYHELHCVKRIRRHLHLGRYYPNMTEDERIREEIHIDHCLEYWREAAMCRGDTTLATFFWRDGLPYSHVYSDHECIDWEALDRWARSRMVDMSDYSVLVQDD